MRIDERLDGGPRARTAADALALRELVLNHITSHRVVRQTEMRLVLDRQEGHGVDEPV
ncbi:hypothetical protein [Pseudactinotalea terrae]|uniref:hypothetical protein n=1 Tax=Pseudactinotalea terrae TaxID=1743262 RepID=UPI0012E1DB5B|nr:hypothetical protein [Pseudactinotalea terrae]